MSSVFCHQEFEAARKQLRKHIAIIRYSSRSTREIYVTIDEKVKSDSAIFCGIFKLPIPRWTQFRIYVYALRGMRIKFQDNFDATFVEKDTRSR